MQKLKTNHTKAMGANRKPTLEVPKRCSINSTTRMAQAMPTMSSAASRAALVNVLQIFDSTLSAGRLFVFSAAACRSEHPLP